MLYQIARKIWRFLPYQARLLAIRLTQHKFTVSVVAMVVNPDGKVLMLDHYLRPGSSWGLPGGFIDRDEAPEAAVRRELKEETGLEITELSLVKVRTIRRHIEIIFRGKGEGTPVLAVREIREARWLFPDELPADMYPHQREMIVRELSPADPDPNPGP